VDRQGSALRDTLFSGGAEPWSNGGFGVSNKLMYNAQGTPINREPRFSYRVEAHHLIPIEQMAETTTLKENAVLAGWDINAIMNGSFHPRDDMDVAVHELQQHHGSHCGDYTKPIKDRLRKIEKTFETICHGKQTSDAQLTLALELTAVSTKALRMILGIRSSPSSRFWKLHNDSLTVYKTSLSEYERRRLLNEQLGGT
jgi:hypothetical protein